MIHFFVLSGALESDVDSETLIFIPSCKSSTSDSVKTYDFSFLLNSKPSRVFSSSVSFDRMSFSNPGFVLEFVFKRYNFPSYSISMLYSVIYYLFFIQKKEKEKERKKQKEKEKKKYLLIPII